MHNIVTTECSIHSCHDFELSIGRETLLPFKYSYKNGTKLKGIVFLIAGFGEDTNSGYLDHIREHTASTFDVVCVTVFYHCFYARPNNGASFYPDKIDMLTIDKYFKEYNIVYTDGDINGALSKLDNEIQKQKNSGKIAPDTKLAIPVTSFPLNGEYQNFGIMQALDHLNVLSFLQKSSLNLEKTYSVALIGSSHGGYIANLCAKIAPSSIDLVIDNSAYIKPPYSFIVGREYNSSKPEFFNSAYADNLMLYFFTKTHWTLDHASPNFFSNDRFRIRDIGDFEHLKSLAQSNTKKTKYISYHSTFDALAPFVDKKIFYDDLNSLGFDATLHIVDSELLVDGRFIKNLHHGMNISIKELINRELPKIYELQPEHDKTIQPITYDCDTLSYTFGFNANLFCGQTAPINKDISISDIIRENFLQNIAYIEKNQPDLYKKLAAFDSAVEQNLYKNKYELVYENGSFDIIEINTNKSYYDINSDRYADIAAKSINFSRDSGVFETFKKIIIPDEDLTKYKQLTIYENNLSGHADILNYVQKNHSATMKNIEKFIFFGVGLGTHITMIDTKISAKKYLIIEDSLELFRLSLFTLAYHKISKKSELVFSVFDTKEEFIPKATYFLNSDFYLNHYIKYFHMLRHSEEKFVEFHLQIASASHHLFFYNSILEQYLRPLEYMQDGFNFLNILKTYPPLGQKPVILLAAGPSLQKNIQWLKHNHEKFIVVALSAVLGILEKEGIVPDIVTHLDGFSESGILFSRLKNISFFNNSIFLIASRTPQNIVNILPKQNIFFFESGTTYKKDFGNLSAFCVGSTTYLLLIALGVSQLYLLGLDLALDGETGKTHSDGHPLVQNLNLETINQEKDIMIFNDNIIEVPGNFDEKVYTTSGFATSIASVNATSGGFKKSSQQVYNLSNGAKFTNTVALPITSNFVDTILPFDKQALRKEILEVFYANSSNKPCDYEYNTVQERLENAFYSKTLIESWQRSLCNTIDEFLNSLIILMNELDSPRSEAAYDLAFIYQEYFKLTASHIFDFFNNEAIADRKYHIQNIHKMFSSHLLNIVDLYISGLKQLTKRKE